VKARDVRRWTTAEVARGAALTVCGFAGPGRIGGPRHRNWSPRTTAQGLLSFHDLHEWRDRPGLSGIVPVALAALAALPLAGLVLSLNRCPGAGPPTRT